MSLTKSHRQTLIRMSVLKKRKAMANGCSARKTVEKLPSYDGFLETQLSGMRVPFHVIRSDSTPWDAKQAYSLALLGARMSCRCHRHLPVVGKSRRM